MGFVALPASDVSMTGSRQGLRERWVSWDMSQPASVRATYKSGRSV